MKSRAAESGPLGLFGGTFDPIHNAHLRLAEEAREALGLDTVRFIPAGDPPHRETPMTAATHRLEMVRLAIAGNPAFACDDSEVLAEGKSYTVLTLERLRREAPARPLVLLLGADAFLGLAGWHRWREILDFAHIGVATRPGNTPHDAHWSTRMSAELENECRHRIAEDAAALTRCPNGAIVPFDMTPLMISASLVRELLSTGRNPRYLLPDSVLDYIGQHFLYH